MVTPYTQNLSNLRKFCLSYVAYNVFTIPNCPSVDLILFRWLFITFGLHKYRVDLCSHNCGCVFKPTFFNFSHEELHK